MKVYNDGVKEYNWMEAKQKAKVGAALKRLKGLELRRKNVDAAINDAKKDVAKAACPFTINQEVTKGDVTAWIDVIAYIPNAPHWHASGYDLDRGFHCIDETWQPVIEEPPF